MYRSTVHLAKLKHYLILEMRQIINKVSFYPEMLLNMQICIWKNLNNEERCFLLHQTYKPMCCLKLDFQKVDQHRGSKWLINVQYLQHIWSALEDRVWGVFVISVCYISCSVILTMLQTILCDTGNGTLNSDCIHCSDNIVVHSDWHSERQNVLIIILPDMNYNYHHSVFGFIFSIVKFHEIFI